jgi:acyl carrier protein phosphodiesterase
VNFLAHLYLSGNSEELLIGNFIADAVKGSNFEGFHPQVVKGIKLHRSIDAFTDSHPVFLQSKRRLVPHFDKYSGVLMDIFYDHFLAANWNSYHPTSLDIYAQDVYALMKRNTHHLPEHSKFMLPYMIKGNWLYNYAHFEGIQSTLNGLSRRTKFVSGMEKGVIYLQQDYALYEKEFAEFFPEIVEFVKKEMTV